MNKKTIGFFIVLVLLAAAGAYSMDLFFRQRTDHDVVDINDLPMKIDGWSGRDIEVTEREYDILETRNLALREYTGPRGEKAHLFVIYSETNRSVFHPPEVCLIGSGVVIEDKTHDMFTHRARDINLNKLLLNRGETEDIVLYCYKSGDFYTDNYYLQQAAFALNQLLGRRDGGATIRVSMSAEGDRADELATLKDFMGEVITEMERL